MGTEGHGSATEAANAQPARADANLVDMGRELLTRAKAGDVQAWSRLYQNNFDRIFRSLCLHVSDPDVAEDLTQETFAEALANLGSFRGDSRFSTWLHGIAINRARRHWRWKRNTANAHDKLTQVTRLSAPAGPDPAAASMRSAKVRALYAILEDIPDNLREVFVLRDIEGLSQREVAARLGISEGNAAVRATRARARVRAELERLGWLTPGGGQR